MKVRELIAGLEALGAPDLDVYYLDEGEDLHQVGGGVIDTEEGSGNQAVILGPYPADVEGGF